MIFLTATVIYLSRALSNAYTRMTDIVFVIDRALAEGKEANAESVEAMRTSLQLIRQELSI